jgi:pyruvate-formate lyase
MCTTMSGLATRTEPTQRITKLREDALRPRSHPNFEVALYGGEAWQQSLGEIWWIVRRGQRTAHILRNMEVVIGPHDLLVGRVTDRPPTEGEEARLAAVEPLLAAQPPAWGQAGHMAPDFVPLLTLGCRGLQERIDQLAARLDPAAPEARPKLAFYRAARAALEGLCDFASRYAEEAERLAAEETDPTRAAELREIAAVCRRVPAYPARTFHEALQAAHFLLFALHYAEGCTLASPGSIDRWAWPYLAADLAAGRLTPERAQELLDAFFITFNTYIPRGAAIGLLVGGRDAQGRCVCNPLTWMVLHALDHVRLAYPNAGLRVHADTDPELLDLALQLLADGCSHPALFNDEVITAGLQAAGLPPEDACDYMNSTCVEITPCGKSNVWVASPYFNLPATLLGLVADVAAGKLAPPPTFAALLEEYKQRLAREIAAAVGLQNDLRYSCWAHRNFPLASCFVADCLERGLDMEWGGARYNWIECSFVGLANVADSLEAMRHFLYERPELTWQRLAQLLESNFAGQEPWRQRLLHEPAKYGNAQPRVDALAVDLMQFCVSEVRRHRTVFGAGFHPGLFAWIMHAALGEQTGATPDGRRAGEALSPGPDPVGGRATAGPTATILSATSFSHQPLLGGVAFNLRFSAATLQGRERRDKVAALLRTYFRRGGAQVQINVVSSQTLREAQQHPERYADLLVRVAGFSEYFVNLSRAAQDELIARAELGL